MIDDRGGLAVATLIYFVFALPAAIFICLKHGFGRNGGFVFLMIFSITRIAGSIAQLVAVNDPSISSVTAAAVLTSSGFSTLLMAQIGLLQRINEGIPSDKGRIPPVVFRIMILALLVAFILGIVGGIDQTSSKPETQHDGQTYVHAVGGLFAAVFGIMSLETLFTGYNISHMIRGDRKLLYACAAAFPFLLVRLIYVEMIDFQVNPSVFNTVNGSTTCVVVQAFMASVEEYIAVFLFLAAGWFTPKLERRQLQAGKMVEDVRPPREEVMQQQQYDYGMQPAYGNQVSGSVQRD